MTTSTLAPVTSIPTVIESARCDRCGARAKVRAVLPSGGELTFCAHHGRRHWSALTRQGADFGPTAE